MFLVFTDVPYQSQFGKIHFELISSRDGSRIKIMHFFSNVGNRNAAGVHSYLNLSVAMGTKAHKFHTYAVVEQILKVIIL